MTSEELKKVNAAKARAYRKTPAGKASMRRVNQRQWRRRKAALAANPQALEKYRKNKRAALARFRKTEHGKRRRREDNRRYSHTDKRLAYQRTYYERHRPAMRLSARLRATRRRRERGVPEKRKTVMIDAAYYRAQYAANPEKYRSAARAWRLANPKKAGESCRRWRRGNPDAVAAHKAKRRMREVLAPVVERIDRRAIYRRDGGRCHICHRSVSPKTFVLDHLVPLSKGGEHAGFNLAVAHFRCNARKHARRVPVQVPLPLVS